MYRLCFFFYNNKIKTNCNTNNELTKSEIICVFTHVSYHINIVNWFWCVVLLNYFCCLHSKVYMIA